MPLLKQPLEVFLSLTEWKTVASVALHTVKRVKLADAGRGCHPPYKQELKSTSEAFAEGRAVSLAL